MVPFGDGLAYCRAGHADSIDDKALQCGDFESHWTTESPQGGYVAATSRAEMEVLPNQQGSTPELSNENIQHERFCRHACDRVSEGADIQPVDAMQLEQSSFIGQCRKSGGYGRSHEILYGMRIEGQAASGQFPCRCVLLQPLDHCPVPEMDPIELADRQGDRRIRFGGENRCDFSAL